MPAVLLTTLLMLLQAGQPGTVSGTIVDPSGGSVPGATVQLEVGALVVAQTQSASDGRFSLTPPSFDRIRLIVTAPGFAQRELSVDIAESPLTIALETAPFFDVVQVTSARGMIPRSDPTVAASVVNSTDIVSSPAAAIDDVLKAVPGFTLFPSSRVANPTTQTMMMRGLGGSGISRSLVLADGVPLNDPFGGWVYWDKVPHVAIDRIEVVRGGGSDLYGADAVAGVVQILTLEPVGPMGRGLIEVGNLGTGRISGFGGTRKDAWTVSAGGQWFTTDGYILVRPAERGPVDRPSGSQHRSAIASLTYAGAWRLGVHGSIFSEDRKNGTRLQVNDTDARVVSGDAAGGLGGGFLSTHVFGGSQTYNQTFTSIDAEAQRSVESLLAVQHVPSHAGGGSVQYTRQRGGANFLLGGEAKIMSGRTLDTGYEDERAVGTVETGGSERIGAAFVRMSVALNERTTLVAGAHADAWHSSSRTSSFSRTVGAFSPRISLAYRMGESGFAIRGSVFGGFRAPTLSELYRTFQVGNDVTVPNERLMPERLKSAETGVSFSRGPASIRVTGFWSVLDDAVTSVTIATSPERNVRQRQNADRIRSIGLEFEGDVRLARALSVAVTGALIDSRFDGHTVLRDYRVPQVPEYSVAGTLRYRNPVWNISAQLRVTGPQFDDDVNTRMLNRATVVDAFAGRTITRRTQIFVGVENLFDVDYDAGRIPLAISGLPRAVRAGIQILLP